MTTAQKPASGRSLKFFHDLIWGKDEQSVSDFRANLPTEWRSLFDRCISSFANCDHEGLGPEAMNDWMASEEWPLLEQSDASKFIEGLKALPWKQGTNPAKVREPVTEDGMYKVGDTIYKVQWNRQKTNLYAKVLRVSRNSYEGKHEVWFDYESGAMKKISASDKMTYEQAREFGAMYGTCVNCGRLLTNELSIALGIGPVCGDRMFGGDFKFMIDDAKLKLAK
jgi:hypothetical protein